MLEARAINRYVNSSPRKMRLVVDLIRGKSVPDALAILHYSTKHAAKVAEKTVRSAVSNIQSKDDAGRVETDSLFIKEVFVNGGPGLKRMLPAPMGRAYRIVKRSNHLTVIIAQRTKKKQQLEKPKSAKQSSKQTAQQEE